MDRAIPTSLFIAGRAQAPPGVRFHHEGDRLVLEAVDDLDGVAGDSFAEPAVHVAFTVDPATHAGFELVGYGFTQFALPVRAVVGGPGFQLNPSPTLHAPPAVVPLVVRAPDGTVTLAAPVDSWHEQILALVRYEGGALTELRWGWQGDLARVPAGFRTTLGLFTGSGASDVFDQWGRAVRSAVGPVARDRTNPVVTHLSYWTDNGAAYWYRTEPDRDLATSVVDTVADLRATGVPVGPVELDSWFYPHETNRPVSRIGYLEAVPPTGMLTWDARADTLPDGMDALADRLGRPPLVLHARHLSTRSPYLETSYDDATGLPGEWWGDLVAHPADPVFFRRWFDDARRWGAVCIEQDWMLLVWFGVRQLREEPGRARDWLRALDAAGSDTGIGLVLCMATPADLLAAAELGQVVAVRTSDDYRYAADPAFLWHWYLTVNRLVGALGVPAFKDCFLTGPAGEDPIDGDPHREAEATLAALSAGIVGIGDRLGRTDPDLVSRLCRSDGTLVKPDEPLALADQSFFDPGLVPTLPHDTGLPDADPTPDPASGPRTARPPDPGRRRLCWATTRSGPWRYVVALHTASTEDEIGDRFELDGEALVYDWRRGTAAPARAVEVTLGHRDWALFVCCPVERSPDGRWALIGDPTKIATMGSQRVSMADGRVVVHRADGEGPVPLRWWHEHTGVTDRPS